MSKNPKAGGAEPATAECAPSFEEALKKLETIVEAMENADLPLEVLLHRFEEGSQLVQMCQARLAEAELKIQQLEKTASGQILVKPAGLAESPAQS
jgi:exodeoxyribonuclease VII small subunit